METFAQICIGGAFTIGSIVLFNHVRVTYFSKKRKYHDSVGSSRRQNELIGKRRK